MKKEKRSKLIFLGKALLATLVFSGLLYIWILIVFSHGKLFSPATAKDNFIDISSMILLAIVFIAFTVWLSRLGEETKEDRKNMSFFGKLQRPLKLMAASTVMVILVRLCDPLMKVARTVEANMLYRSATDIIEYPTERICDRPLFNTPAENPVMLINENKKTVTFLYGDFGDLIKKLKLRKESEDNSPEGLFVQYTAQLDSGGTVSTYYSFDPDDERYDATLYWDCEFTSGVEMTNADGEKWYAAIEPKDQFSFTKMTQAQVNGAEALSDTVIELSGAPALDPPCGSYSFPALFINTEGPDNYYIYTLCDDRNNTGYTQQVSDTKLEKIYKNEAKYGIDELIVQAKIDIPEKGMTVYACRSFDTKEISRTDKYVIVTADGSVYMGGTSLRSGIDTCKYAVSGNIPLRYFLEGWDTSGYTVTAE